MKTITEINRKIHDGTASVLTAQEFKELVRSGRRPKLSDVDIVTTGTFGVMSGTLAVLTVPIGPRNLFERADRAWLNDVPAFPGPCPNERLGVVDLIIYGTSYAGHSYGGGHLFRDLVSGKTVHAEIESGGKRYGNDITLDDVSFARLVSTRGAFRNYQAFINRSSSKVSTIFSACGLEGPDAEISVCGCGDINPLENDPHMRTLGIGSKILLNGTTGYIMGQGTRSSPERPNLAAFADMRGMIPAMMGGMKTSHSPECLTSFAVPIPVLDQHVLDALSILNENIVLPVVDIMGRIPCGEAMYDSVWEGSDRVVRENRSSCIECDPCTAQEICPTGAISQGKPIDRTLCVNCGTCAQECPAGVYMQNLGEIPFCGRRIPITFRQSDRSRAEALCRDLRDRILRGTFTLTERCGEM